MWNQKIKLLEDGDIQLRYIHTNDRDVDVEIIFKFFTIKGIFIGGNIVIIADSRLITEIELPHSKTAEMSALYESCIKAMDSVPGMRYKQKLFFKVPDSASANTKKTIYGMLLNVVSIITSKIPKEYKINIFSCIKDERMDRIKEMVEDEDYKYVVKIIKNEDDPFLAVKRSWQVIDMLNRKKEYTYSLDILRFLNDSNYEGGDSEEVKREFIRLTNMMLKSHELNSKDYYDLLGDKYVLLHKMGKHDESDRTLNLLRDLSIDDEKIVGSGPNFHTIYAIAASEKSLI